MAPVVEITEPRSSVTITTLDLERATELLVAGVRPWDSGCFTHLRPLQAAPRNHGSVDAMQRNSDGLQAAVKRMPNWWVLEDHAEFKRRHAREAEQPWVDLALLSELNRRRFSYACDFVGIFRDDEWTYAATRLASGGDLFAWAQSLVCAPGPAREAAMRPIAGQLLAAVRWLHDLDVAHRDLSLENVVLVPEGDEESPFQVKVIDFGMASVGRQQDGPGQAAAGMTAKRAYQAPELHSTRTFDAFLADNFALGVMIYGMAVKDYPWACTLDGHSEHFDLARRCGVLALLARRMTHGGKRLPEVLSTHLLRMLAGLLALMPRDRTSVGEACFDKEDRPSAACHRWLEPRSPAAAQAGKIGDLQRESSGTSSASTADSDTEVARGTA